MNKDPKVRLLIVEDEEGARRAVFKILESMGYDVSEASDSDEALKLLKDGPGYDVLITDLSLPGMDGWTLASRAGSVNPGIAVALLTGWDIDEEDERIAEYGVSEILSKPIDMHKLKAAIERMMARKTG